MHAVVRKSITLALVFAMASLLLAACSGNKGGNNAPPQQGTNRTAQPEGQGNGSSEPEVPTVKINMTIWGQQISGGKTKYYDQVLEEINTRLAADKGFRVDPQVMVIPTDQYATKVNTMLAGGDKIDAIRNPGDLTTLVDRQAAMDLTDLIQAHGQNLLAMYPENVWDQVSRNGRIYAIPFLSFPFFYAGIIRGDWLEQVGKERPTTLAELEDVMRAFRDGGFNRSVALTGNFSASAGGAVEQFLYPIFSEHPGDYTDGSGSIQPKFTDPGYKAFIGLLAKWYAEKLIDDSLFNSNESTETGMISNDALGIAINNMWQLQFGPLNTVVTGRPETNLQFIPALQDMKAYPSTGATADFLMIPASSDNAEYVVKYIDWFLNDEANYRLVMNGLEDVTYTVQDGIIGVPEAEQEALLDTYKGKALSGPYDNNLYNLKFNTMYRSEGELPQSTEINAIYGDLDLSKVYVSPVYTIGVNLSDEARLGQANANKVVDKWILEMITGSKSLENWDQMLAEWEAAGGALAYQEYTQGNQAQ